MTPTRAALICLALSAATALWAHSGVQNPTVMARMHAMMTIKDHIKLMSAMAKGEAPFDGTAARAAAAAIAAQSAEIPARFEAPETDPKSEALPVIWDEFDRFTQLAQDLGTTAAKAAETIQQRADLAPALADIGGACRACHRDYRKEKP